MREISHLDRVRCPAGGVPLTAARCRSAGPDDAMVPSFGPRMRCSRCGKLGATAIPNWVERAACAQCPCRKWVRHWR
jgi:hypothetical protein